MPAAHRILLTALLALTLGPAAAGCRPSAPFTVVGWRPEEPVEILRPERSWEGMGEPLAPSSSGRAWKRKRELRDPALFVEA